MSKFQPVRGMRDFLAQEAKTMRYVEQTAREIARLYDFEEIITPVVESYEFLPQNQVKRFGIECMHLRI